ncbi:MAG TPA: sugar ABC transporter substrate-binding protein, partial [Chloroflexota bacterium]
TAGSTTSAPTSIAGTQAATSAVASQASTSLAVTQTATSTASSPVATSAIAAPAVAPASISLSTWELLPLPAGVATTKEVAAFQVANPTIKVNVIATPNSPLDASLTKVQAMMASGTPPDVTLMRPNYVATLYTARSIQTIDPFLAREKTLSRASYFKGALARLIFANQLYGLPSDYWFTVLYYNRDIFQAQGVTPPDGTWTWDAFLSAATKLTTVSGGSTRYGTITPPWQIRVRDNGGDELDAKQTTCLLDQGPAIDGIQWIADLGLKQHVVPTAKESAALSDQNRFTTGNLAMFPQGNYFQGIAATSARFHWDLAPLPTGPVGRRPLAGGSNFLMPTGVKTPDASWLLMKFMGGPEGGTFRGQDAGLFPSMPALAKPEIIPAFSADQISRILATGQDAIPLPFVPQYAQMDKIISAGLAPVWAGQSTAKEATAKLVPQVNALLQS